MTDAEVGPDSLMMDGKDWLYREVRRDETERENLAKQASLEQFEASAEAHRLQNVADADYLRDHEGRAWAVSARETLARRLPPSPA